MKAGDVMTRRVVSVKPNTSLVEAAQLMIQNRISGLPVLDEQGKLVGMVTEGDLLRRVETGTERYRPRWLEFLIGPGRLATEYVHTHGRKIQEVMTTHPETIVEETPLNAVVLLMERKRIKRTFANVIVREGVVELWGTTFDERERQALRVVAENVPGVNPSTRPSHQPGAR